MKLLFTVLILCTFIGNAFTQNEGDLSNDEWKQFARIYLLQKEFKTPPDSLFISVLARHRMTQARYAEILRARTDNREANVTAQEEMVLTALVQVHSAFRAEFEMKVQDLCKAYQMDCTKYLALEQQFKTDQAFQHKLKPYFAAILKEQHQ